jgi:hypothetical protein
MAYRAKRIQVWCDGLPGTKVLTYGGSAFLYYYSGNNTELVKLATNLLSSKTNMEIEKRAYQRLDNHPNIIP